MKVLVASIPTRSAIPELKKMVPENIEFIVPKSESEDELVELARDVEIILCKSLSEDVLRAAEKLKLIQLCCAGTERLPWKTMNTSKVYVSNIKGAESVMVAEHAMALLLALDKRIVSRHNKFQLGILDRESNSEISGKTIGILGLGSIGAEIAKRAMAFGMRVLAIKRNPSSRAGSIERYMPLDFLSSTQEMEKVMDKIEFIGGPGDLEKILKTSDFVVVVMPSTPETRGLIGERELRMMKQSAYLVIISRADIIEEEALYNTLREKWIAGAGIDVWHKDAKYLIHKLDNVVATPHVGGVTGSPARNEVKVLAENILRIYKGEKPINIVDRTLRY